MRVKVRNGYVAYVENRSHFPGEIIDIDEQTYYSQEHKFEPAPPEGQKITVETEAMEAPEENKMISPEDVKKKGKR